MPSHTTIPELCAWQTWPRGTGAAKAPEGARRDQGPGCRQSSGPAQCSGFTCPKANSWAAEPRCGSFRAVGKAAYSTEKIQEGHLRITVLRKKKFRRREVCSLNEAITSEFFPLLSVPKGSGQHRRQEMEWRDSGVSEHFHVSPATCLQTRPRQNGGTRTRQMSASRRGHTHTHPFPNGETSRAHGLGPAPGGGAAQRAGGDASVQRERRLQLRTAALGATFTAGSTGTAARPPRAPGMREQRA